MTTTHATGAAGSYGARYLLKGIFNIAVGEEDTDGNETEETISNDQLADLIALLTEMNANRANFLKMCKIERLEDMPARKYKDAMARLEEKRRQS